MEYAITSEESPPPVNNLNNRLSSLVNPAIELQMEAVERSIDETQTHKISLPVLATAADLREVVQFLKRRPEGTTLTEAMDAIRQRLFDPRKIFAYEFWGIVSKEAGRLKLSPLGWEFARRFARDAEVYRAVLVRTPLYHLALEKIYQQGQDPVTYHEMGVFWREQHVEALEGDDEEKLENYAASFFHLCHAAEIGMLIVGRKGHPTRLRVYADELEKYIHSKPLETAPTFAERSAGGNSIVNGDWPQPRPTDHRLKAMRVFVSPGQNHLIAETLQETLTLAGLEYEIVDRKPIGPMPVSDQAFQGMRQCHAGIFLITEEDYAKDYLGRKVLNENVSVEIGAAFIHFDRRVVLLVDKILPLPANLQGLYSWQFESKDLTWDAAVQLVRIVKNFKRELEKRPGSEH